LLSPLVPIQELIEKIKALETAAVHTPSLPWETTRIASAPISQPSTTSPHPPLPATTIADSVSELTGAHTDWGRFVAYVNEKERLLGSVLEHGSPLKQENGLIEIGFPAGSYYLTAAQDTEFISEVQGLACTFSGGATVIRVTSIETGFADAPLSLAEKKKCDAEQHLDELKQEIENHPVIKEAQRVFGSIITEVRKL
jgi:DNA polymerase-3 subunit gamma/tau